MIRIGRIDHQAISRRYRLPARASVARPRWCGDLLPNRYITLDDDTVLEAARGAPSGFVRGLDHAIVDEVQRAPDLLRAIKKTIDVDRRPGRFLLTGSANVLTFPKSPKALLDECKS